MLGGGMFVCVHKCFCLIQNLLAPLPRFLTRHVCHSFQIHSENEYKERERERGMIIWNEGLRWDRYFEWHQAEINGCNREGEGNELQIQWRTGEENKKWIWGIKWENSDLKAAMNPTSLILAFGSHSLSCFSFSPILFECPVCARSLNQEGQSGRT